jgi:hypothetical protein
MAEAALGSGEPVPGWRASAMTRGRAPGDHGGGDSPEQHANQFEATPVMEAAHWRSHGRSVPARDEAAGDSE